MKLKKITRRDFLEGSLKVAAGAVAGSIALKKFGCSPKEMIQEEKPVVSVA